MNIFIGKNNQEWGRHIGSRLKLVGKNQNDLAEKIDVSSPCLSKAMRDKSPASLDMVRKIENALMQWELEYARGKA